LAFELFGIRDSLAVLANVSAQGVVLKRQASSQVVRAEVGAQVVASEDVSLIIPPQALTTDTAVRLQALEPATVPAAPTNQRLTAVVNATPSGLRFNIPARMSFPVGAQLKPGTQVPLLMLNSAGTQFDRSEFTAVVDDTGRTAWADITHFTTFALGIPNDQFLTVSSIGPSVAPPGTSITISGSGFSENLADNQVAFTTSNGIGLGQVTAATPTSLTVVIPADAVSGGITVRALERTSLPFRFPVVVPLSGPTIKALTPRYATAGASSVDVQITGSAFASNSYATYDGVPVPTTFIDSNTLVVPISRTQVDPGVHRIGVVSSTASSNIVDFAVRFPVPAVSGVSADLEDIVPPGSTLIGVIGSGFTLSSKVLVNGFDRLTFFLSSTLLLLDLSSESSMTLQISVQNPSPGGGVSVPLTFNFVSGVLVPVNP
jgi:hypothetical protein